MQSAIYRGKVRHRRKKDKVHEFQYQLFMMYLDLDELSDVFKGVPFWSSRSRWAPAHFRREDYLQPSDVPLGEAVRNRVEDELGFRPTGPIRMLTHLRYFGYVMNPVTFYFCFADDGQTLQAIASDINNTPWDERRCYVHATDPDQHKYRFDFQKDFHVSPFLPMNTHYQWTFTKPAESLVIHMENHREGSLDFDATLTLRREPITAWSLNVKLMRYPLMTAKVLAGIYWQALKLYLKGVTFYPHPKTDEKSPQEVPVESIRS
jgi:DUF1365 family protein